MNKDFKFICDGTGTEDDDDGFTAWKEPGFPCDFFEVKEAQGTVEMEFEYPDGGYVRETRIVNGWGKGNGQKRNFFTRVRVRSTQPETVKICIGDGMGGQGTQATFTVSPPLAVDLSLTDRAKLDAISTNTTPPTRAETAWLAQANFNTDQVIALTPPWWATGINFGLYADSTIAGNPQIDLAIGYEDAAGKRCDMAVYSLAATPNNQQVILQMARGVAGTSTAPATITRLGNRTLVQVNSALPSKVYIGFRFIAGGTIKLYTSYSWTN